MPRPRGRVPPLALHQESAVSARSPSDPRSPLQSLADERQRLLGAVHVERGGRQRAQVALSAVQTRIAALEAETSRITAKGHLAPAAATARLAHLQEAVRRTRSDSALRRRELTDVAAAYNVLERRAIAAAPLPARRAFDLNVADRRTADRTKRATALGKEAARLNAQVQDLQRQLAAVGTGLDDPDAVATAAAKARVIWASRHRESVARLQRDLVSDARENNRRCDQLVAARLRSRETADLQRAARGVARDAAAQEVASLHMDVSQCKAALARHTVELDQATKALSRASQEKSMHRHSRTTTTPAAEVLAPVVDPAQAWAAERDRLLALRDTQHAERDRLQEELVVARRDRQPETSARPSVVSGQKGAAALEQALADTAAAAAEAASRLQCLEGEAMQLEAEACDVERQADELRKRLWTSQKDAVLAQLRQGKNAADVRAHGVEGALLELGRKLDGLTLSLRQQGVAL